MPNFACQNFGKKFGIPLGWMPKPWQEFWYALGWVPNAKVYDSIINIYN
jgi:hypothetical protein